MSTKQRKICIDFEEISYIEVWRKSKDIILGKVCGNLPLWKGGVKANTFVMGFNLGLINKVLTQAYNSCHVTKVRKFKLESPTLKAVLPPIQMQSCKHDTLHFCVK